MQTDDLMELTLHMALLSLMAIGGISAILPDMQRFVVELHRWVSASDFADAYALAQSAPGPNMMRSRTQSRCRAATAGSCCSVSKERMAPVRGRVLWLSGP